MTPKLLPYIAKSATKKNGPEAVSAAHPTLDTIEPNGGPNMPVDGTIPTQCWFSISKFSNRAGDA